MANFIILNIGVTYYLESVYQFNSLQGVPFDTMISFHIQPLL